VFERGCVRTTSVVRRIADYGFPGGTAGEGQAYVLDAFGNDGHLAAHGVLHVAQLGVHVGVVQRLGRASGRVSRRIGGYHGGCEKEGQLR